MPNVVNAALVTFEELVNKRLEHLRKAQLIAFYVAEAVAESSKWSETRFLMAASSLASPM